jgi:hypothetical protein
VCLDAGDIVRIVDGAGTLVHARTGVLWITHERAREDVVLEPVQSHRIAEAGVTLVEAHRAARVVIEVPHGIAAPRRVELCFSRGSRRRPIALPGAPARSWLERTRAVLARAFLTPVHYPHVDEFAEWRAHRRRLRSSAVVDDFSPEAVRNRLLSAAPLPYY